MSPHNVPEKEFSLTDRIGFPKLKLSGIVSLLRFAGSAAVERVMPVYS